MDLEHFYEGKTDPLTFAVYGIREEKGLQYSEQSSSFRRLFLTPQFRARGGGAHSLYKRGGRGGRGEGEEGRGERGVASEASKEAWAQPLENFRCN